MRWRVERRLPAVVLAIGLVLSASAGWLTWRAMHAQQALRIENAAERADAAIDARIDAYIAILRGTAGLFAGSDTVSRADFHSYVERLELGQHYPGIQGLGYSAFVVPGRADEVEARARRDGLEGFHLWRLDGDWRAAARSAGGGYAILYLEPLDARNAAALGFDMSSEATRRAAMQRARDTGNVAASGRVRLVQEITPGDRQAGFLVYVPIYATGAIGNTVDARRSDLRGFVYAAFRADDLLRGILGPENVSELRVAVYDGPADEQNLLHRSMSFMAHARLEIRRTTSVGGRTWTLVFQPGSGFPNAHAFATALWTGIGGALMTIALFLLMRGEVRARELAERRAEQLRDSERALLEASHQKDEFLTIISHELRTPLNAILGWSSMLRRNQLPHDQRERAIETIERNATAQAHLVNDLLDASRTISGRMRVTRVPVDAGAVLTSAVESIRPAAHAAGVALEWGDPGTLGSIEADAGRLQQIVGNLMSNAVKFTPRGGRITLAATRNPSQLTIRVSDTGIGMDPAFVPYAFERFRQADTSSTRVHGGVGLGLAIVQALVELHGGTVAAHSDGPGRGSTFTVTLPAL